MLDPDKVKELITRLNFKSEVREPIGSNGKKKDANDEDEIEPDNENE